MNRKIILASASPRRKKILEQTGLHFTVEVSNFDEKIVAGMKPAEFVELQSLEKAKMVAKKHKDAIIIGADTIVILEKEMLGKPKSKKDAREMLRKLSGKTHIVFTGFTIIDTANSKTVTNHVQTKVRFKNLSDEEISTYVEVENPMDQAGSYGIQGKAGLFVEYVEGDYFNVVGLPLINVSETLKEFGINILKTYEK